MECARHSNGTTCEGAGHTTGVFQSIRSVNRLSLTPRVEIGASELIANWRCAARLADKEGLHDTARRLRNDAQVFQDLMADNQAIILHITL